MEGKEVKRRMGKEKKWQMRSRRKKRQKNQWSQWKPKRKQLKQQQIKKYNLSCCRSTSYISDSQTLNSKYHSTKYLFKYQHNNTMGLHFNSTRAVPKKWLVLPLTPGLCLFSNKS
ncbi:hypothetical protein NQD34_007105 [Periophthalmus magnuspinnatus]|nr:hypothetical protein NQD34_007105 [Periophthalmus magnuspinnatus]